MGWTDNPARDWEQHQRDLDRKEEEYRLMHPRPRCYVCDCVIESEYAVKYDGDFYCEDCEEIIWTDILRDRFVEKVEDE